MMTAGWSEGEKYMKANPPMYPLAFLFIGTGEQKKKQIYFWLMRESRRKSSMVYGYRPYVKSELFLIKVMLKR